MEIKLESIKVSEISKGYKNDGENGVFAYGGKLNVRPPYQREFVYKDAKRDAVIRTVLSDYPLNVMYWAKNDEDSYEVIDGQQRTISICDYINGDYSVDEKYFHSLNEQEKKKIMDYELSIYICIGENSEKMKWFEIINISPEKLTPQELRNAVYTGPFISDARSKFSSSKGYVQTNLKNYLTGSAIRQEYLETALRWISRKDNESIESFMSKHQEDQNSDYLFNEFILIMNWVKKTFVVWRKQMSMVDWGELYYSNKDVELDPAALEEEISSLFKNEEVQNKKGIYEYVLSEKRKNDERLLNIRLFSDSIKSSVYEKQNGNCAICGNHFEINKMEADHINAWSNGGRTETSNCQMLCTECNRIKSNK